MTRSYNLGLDTLLKHCSYCGDSKKTSQLTSLIGRPYFSDAVGRRSKNQSIKTEPLTKMTGGLQHMPKH